MAKGWTEARRRAQAERCRANRPWEHSTGPKSAAGKARSALNAYKHGGDAAYKALIKEMLHHNREFLKSAGALTEIELIKKLEKQAKMVARTKKTGENEVKEYDISKQMSLSGSTG